MLVRDQDFTVEEQHGIIRCLPKTPEAASAIKVLQLAITKILPQLPDAPAVSVEVDGVVGPSLTLATQVIAQRLASGPHQGLAQLCGLQPEQAVPAVAEYCMEIAGYIEQTLTADPNALLAPKTMGEPIDPIATLKSLFTGKRIAAMAGTLLGVAAFVGLGAMVQRRTLGVADRSGMLPPSDGTDEFDEEEIVETDETDESAPFVTGRIIDAEAIEIPNRAA